MFCWLRNNPLVWLLFLGLQLPSVRFFFKYIPADYRGAAIVFFVAAMYFLYSLLFDAKVAALLKRLLDRKAIVYGLVLLLAVVNFFAYPIADSLKEQGRGSNQDDALIEAVHGLLQGENPFETVSYDNQHPSAGPGWVLMSVPIVAANCYFLLTPLYLLIAALAIQKITGRREPAALFILFLCSSPAFWELMIVGSDFIAIGSLFVLIAALLFHAEKLRSRIWSAILLGFTVTARAVFFYLAPLFAIFEWKRNRSRAALLFLLSCVIAFSVHLSFYLWNPEDYSPLKRVFMGVTMQQGEVITILSLIISSVAVLWSIITLKNEIESWMLRLWLCIAVPMFFAAIGDLRSVGWNPAAWEGANYFALSMPLFACWLSYIFSLNNFGIHDQRRCHTQAAPDSR
jgi:hypothetical protein